MQHPQNQVFDSAQAHPIDAGVAAADRAPLSPHFDDAEMQVDRIQQVGLALHAVAALTRRERLSEGKTTLAVRDGLAALMDVLGQSIEANAQQLTKSLGSLRRQAWSEANG